MFTQKTVVTKTTGNFSEKLSKSLDDLMNKGMETLDAGMKVLDEAFKETESDETESVTTTIRIILTPQHVSDLAANRTLTFKAEGVTILLEGGAA